ncbi:hypothetical protein R3P38DRAFT_1732528 [Favolaschia claudopus]|uniref:Uncharacterized protein n=1 Tax=Favolaschia claudopus TaxID=2862362 RepID=A0AAW0A7V8_9AGAR
MHPCLQLSASTRAKIPLRIRRASLEACRISASPEERSSLIDKVIHWPPPSLIPLLPVFHAFLEHSLIHRISDILDRLDSLSETSEQLHVFRHEIFYAMGSLRAVSMILRQNAAPADAFSDLWKNLWPWIQFLEGYQDVLPETLITASERGITTTVFISALRENPEAEELMLLSLVDICSILGGAWFHLVHADVTRYQAAGEVLDMLLECLRVLIGHPTWSRAAADALVTGAGPGTAADLASLALIQLNRYLPTTRPYIFPNKLIFALDNLIVFLGDASGIIDEELKFDPVFREALLAKGLVTLLTRLCRAGFEGNLPVDTQEMFYEILLTYLHPYPRHRWTTEALQAEFLHTVFQAAKRLPESIDDVFDRLSSTTMLHSSLSQLRVSLNAIEDLDAQVMDLKINSLPAFRHWDRFISVVQDRFTALDAYNAGNLKIPVACHNFEG